MSIIARSTFAAFAAATIVMSAGSASAAVYTSESAFVSAIHPLHLHETFQSVTTSGPTLNLAANGYATQLTTPALAFLAFDLGGNRYLTTSGASDGFSRSVTLNFTSGNVTAVGGSFFQTSAGGAFLSNPVTLTFSNGTMQVLTPSGPSDFFGYTSTLPIASLTISPDASHHFVSLDNLRIGSVPAPSAAALLAGACAFTLRRRR